MKMVIHKTYTMAEIEALPDKVNGEAYIPTDIDPKIMYIVDEKGGLYEYEREPIFLESPVEETVADRLMKNKGWIKATPLNQDHMSVIDGLGIKFGNLQSQGAGINRPNYFIPYENGEVIALQYSGEPKIFDQDGNLVGTIPTGYGNPRLYEDNGNIQGASGGDYNPETGLLAIAMYNYHIVKIFQKQDDGSWIYFGFVGTGNQTRNIPLLENDNLSNPRDCKWISTGNLAVSCYTGRYAEGDTDSGYIAEFAVSKDGGGDIFVEGRPQ